MSDELLQDLTDAQREAVLAVEGPLLILAGPGSGKTRVLTRRIAWLLAQGIADEQILALTFTNKAADEMRGRVDLLAPGRSTWIGTFHRFGARLLRKYAPLVGLEENFTIYDADDSSVALRRTLAQLKVDSAFVAPEAVARAISWAKNNLILPREYEPRPGHPLGGVVQQVYPAYQAGLRASNAVDFDDLLLHVATLLRENAEVRRALDERYRFILVDEYQDTNLAQYAIARALSIDHPNLAVTDDPDQSIYGWRGANLNNILEFERDFPEVHVVRLERNYRSTQRILQVAAELITHNLRRKEKALYTHNCRGEPVRLVTYPTQKDEAEAIAARIAGEIRSGRRRARDFAVFYRTNALSRAFEFALRQAAVPYQLVQGVEFFQRKEIKDVLAYLQLLNNPADAVALGRVINTPVRGIGKTTLQRLGQYAAAQKVPLLEAARRVRQIVSIGPRPATQVSGFVRLFDRLAALAGGLIEELLGHVLAESGYAAQWTDSGDAEDEERLANVQELLTVAREFDERHPGSGHIEAFLEETALVNDTDDWEGQRDRVTLMTLHASKGLEFPVVYLVAVEEGLLPHERSREHADQLEEERRLMFVGITRAQQRLEISRAQYRDFRGQRKMTVPSPFLMELPRSEMEVVEWKGAPPEGSGAEQAAPGYAERAVLGLGSSDLETAPGYTGQASGMPVEGELPRGRTRRVAEGGPRAMPERRAKTVPLASAGLMTAAAMAAGGTPSPAPAPDAFQQGMLVLHPQYGLGRVVALSGSGPQRRATVDFPGPPGRQQFLLAASPLRPVKERE
jgi:DNA helicase-2/ATP-dependent DNA helicase PcrA